MNIMELGAIGELVGGVAVIGSLLYVGLQIRRNTAATHAGSHQAFTDSINLINLEQVRDPAVADLWLRGCEDRSRLDANERWRFDILLHSIFHVFETLFFQNQVGAVDRHLLAAEKRSMAAIFSTPGVQAWWTANPFSFANEFRGHVDSIAQGAATSLEGA